MGRTRENVCTDQNVMSVPERSKDIEQLLPHVAVSEWPEKRPITHDESLCALLRYYTVPILECVARHR
jgi:hypothetical protein